MKRIGTRAGFWLFWRVTFLWTIALPVQAEQLHIIGSSTAFPFMKTLKEYMIDYSYDNIPILQSSGSNIGILKLCQPHPNKNHIAVTSRPMTRQERADCAKKNQTTITEIILGYDGITLAHSNQAPPFSLTLNQLALALAHTVPNPADPDNWIPNPYHNWHQLDASLPDEPLAFAGPPTSSGTRQILKEKVLVPYCAGHTNAPAACQDIRTDKAFIPTGENDRLVIAGLIRNPHTIGIVGYNWLQKYAGKIQAVGIDNLLPSPANIQSRAYPLTRPLFLYFQHTTTEKEILQDVLLALNQPDVWGPHGLLEQQGLILPAEDAYQTLRQFLPTHRQAPEKKRPSTNRHRAH